MCDICCILHEQGGVATFTRWNRAQMRARSHMLCADLGCSLYVRGLIKADCVQMAETISQDDEIARLNDNMSRFIANMTFRDGVANQPKSPAWGAGVLTPWTSAIPRPRRVQARC
jgi:hypothetical protein